jgi:hypothetical protein
MRIDKGLKNVIKFAYESKSNPKLMTAMDAFNNGDYLTLKKFINMQEGSMNFVSKNESFGKTLICNSLSDLPDEFISFVNSKESRLISWPAPIILQPKDMLIFHEIRKVAKKLVKKSPKVKDIFENLQKIIEQEAPKSYLKRYDKTLNYKKVFGVKSFDEFIILLNKSFPEFAESWKGHKKYFETPFSEHLKKFVEYILK